MRCFLGDMEKIPGGTFYGEKLRDQIYRMLDGMNYRLDPTVYVNSYISKVY